jgi:hypothetical protein
MRTSTGWTAAAATAASTVATHDVQYFLLRNKGNAKVSASLLFTPQLRVPNPQLRDPQECKNATRTIANPEKNEAHAQRVTAARATCDQEPLQHTTQNAMRNILTFCSMKQLREQIFCDEGARKNDVSRETMPTSTAQLHAKMRRFPALV